MTCTAVEPWLLSARAPADLPERVGRHLAQCSRCALWFDQLARADVAAAQLAPPANPAARARLDARLACAAQEPAWGTLPARAVRAEPAAPKAGGSVPRWALGVAAAALLALGWLAGRFGPHKPVTQLTDQRQPPAARPTLAPGLLAKVARHSSRVAADAAPAARADAFYQIAADVRADATRRAAAGDVEALPRLIALHDRMLRLGSGRQLSRLPEPQRGTAVAEMAAGLDRSAEECAAAAERLPPAAGDALRPLAASCRDAAAALRQGAPATADDWPSPATPLESLAAQTIRVGEADAPLARADEAAQLAALLSQAATLLAIADLPDDAARVGGALDAVLERGVAANLEQVEAADAAGKYRQEVAKVRDRAGRATEVLERNMAKAPPAAQAGLQRALAASDSGRGKASGKGKSPGGWKKGDGEHPGKGKGDAPPGWQKKP